MTAEPLLRPTALESTGLKDLSSLERAVVKARDLQIFLPPSARLIGEDPQAFIKSAEVYTVWRGDPAVTPWLRAIAPPVTPSDPDQIGGRITLYLFSDRDPNQAPFLSAEYLAGSGNYGFDDVYREFTGSIVVPGYQLQAATYYDSWGKETDESAFEEFTKLKTRQPLVQVTRNVSRQGGVISVGTSFSYSEPSRLVKFLEVREEVPSDVPA